MRLLWRTGPLPPSDKSPMQRRLGGTFNLSLKAGKGTKGRRLSDCARRYGPPLKGQRHDLADAFPARVSSFLSITAIRWKSLISRIFRPIAPRPARVCSDRAVRWDKTRGNTISGYASLSPP